MHAGTCGEKGMGKWAEAVRSFEPKGLPSLIPPLADLRIDQTPLPQLHLGSATDNPLPLELSSSQSK